jgi:thiol-disulfide isomerase/thioredoxin
MKFCFAIVLSFLSLIFFAQSGAKVGDVLPNLPIDKVLNLTTQKTDLKTLQTNITIIDFFGTWCVPCIKALPELDKLKAKFKNDLNVLLVSIEKEDKLTKFIAAKQPFSFPIIVDEQNVFTDALQPPSYPYTVIVNQNLKVIHIANAVDLTEELIAKLIKENPNMVVLPPMERNIFPKLPILNITALPPMNPLIKLSQDFMYAAKTNEDVTSYIEKLKTISYKTLVDSLPTDNDKKAFWINLYNAYVISSLYKNAEQYNDRSKFFKAKNIVVAGKTFSLDKIEHGILRRSKIKWSLGYLSKLFPGKTEKQLRVKKLDYRIHFALNCGARSCPPIAFYKNATINTQLDVATKAYLTSEVQYNKENNTLKLPALMNWFRRDFGGKRKIISLLKEKNIVELTTKPTIKFKPYDWSLYLENY